MAWLRLIQPEEATGRLAKVYAEAVNRAGRVFQILRAMSLNPGSLAASMGLYTQVMHGRSELSRAQREMLAVVVSRANDCHY